MVNAPPPMRKLKYTRIRRAITPVRQLSPVNSVRQLTRIRDCREKAGESGKPSGSCRDSPGRRRGRPPWFTAPFTSIGRAGASLGGFGLPAGSLLHIPGYNSCSLLLLNEGSKQEQQSKNSSWPPHTPARPGRSTCSQQAVRQVP